MALVVQPNFPNRGAQRLKESAERWHAAMIGTPGPCWGLKEWHVSETLRETTSERKCRKMALDELGQWPARGQLKVPKDGTLSSDVVVHFHDDGWSESK